MFCLTPAARAAAGYGVRKPSPDVVDLTNEEQISQSVQQESQAGALGGSLSWTLEPWIFGL